MQATGAKERQQQDLTRELVPALLALWPHVEDYMIPAPLQGMRYVDITPHTITDELAQTLRGGSDFIPYVQLYNKESKPLSNSQFSKVDGGWWRDVSGALASVLRWRGPRVQPQGVSYNSKIHGYGLACDLGGWMNAASDVCMAVQQELGRRAQGYNIDLSVLLNVILSNPKSSFAACVCIVEHEPWRPRYHADVDDWRVDEAAFGGNSGIGFQHGRVLCVRATCLWATKLSLTMRRASCTPGSQNTFPATWPTAS